MTTEVLINGEPSAGVLPVTDSSVLRGDACFEVLRSYHGVAFALDAHVARLERSAGALEIGLPDTSSLRMWIEKSAAEIGNGAVRVVVTRGSSVPGVDDPSRVVVFGHEWPDSEEPGRLLPVTAPWHSAGAPWELAGAKFTSYAPNMAAARRARSEGFSDALLVSTKGEILEGSTFSVGWVVDDVLETPGLGLGILDSITRLIVLDLASQIDLMVVEDVWGLERLANATEVMAWSTLREIQPVVAVGDLQWDPGPWCKSLSTRFETLTSLGTNQH